MRKILDSVGIDEFRELKREYKRAVKAGLDRFMWRGEVLLVSYAKYLIEYIESETGFGRVWR